MQLCCNLKQKKSIKLSCKNRIENGSCGFILFINTPTIYFYNNFYSSKVLSCSKKYKLLLNALNHSHYTRPQGWPVIWSSTCVTLKCKKMQKSAQRGNCMFCLFLQRCVCIDERYHKPLFKIKINHFIKVEIWTNIYRWFLCRCRVSLSYSSTQSK